jgi:hypothetical protein
MYSLREFNSFTFLFVCEWAAIDHRAFAPCPRRDVQFAPLGKDAIQMDDKEFAVCVLAGCPLACHISMLSLADRFRRYFFIIALAAMHAISHCWSL